MKRVMLGVLAVGGIAVLAIAARQTAVPNKRADAVVSSNEGIRIECRLIRGDELARLLGYSAAYGDPRAVYIVGYVFNETEDTLASVRFKAGVRSENYTGWQELSVAVVPPNGRWGVPFVKRLPAPLRAAELDVSSLHAETRVLEVRRK